MADQGFLEQTLDLINKSKGICQRLNAWCTHHPDSDAPLTHLVHRQIKKLDARLLSLGESVIERNPNGPSHAETALDLAQTKVCLFETLELLDFHNREERCGHDGALNAAFATMHILKGMEDHSNTGRNNSNQTKLHRIGWELHGLVRSMFEKGDSVSWTSADVLDNFSTSRPKIIDFLTRTTEQFKPRHVYAYRALTDTPYVIDAAAEAFSGSFGTVQKVNHRTTGESFAMKIFRVRNAFLEKDRRNILRELGILEVCCHKNIVELVEAFSLDNGRSIRLVMAPWAPCTLATFLHESDSERAGRCPWFDPGAAESDHCVFRIMFELADAVSHLHDKMIKHKDLKPDNILLYQEGSRHVTPLITDVGVSKIEIPGAGTKYTDSTYAYLAPEQRKKQSSDLRSDVWQLGCCFAELFAVARGGAAGYRTLHESFNNDDPNCSCSIAGEHDRFVTALHKICWSGNSSARRMYLVLTGMLTLDPADRLDIVSVRDQISKFFGVQGGLGVS
ncbi:Serine/threonine-protein kinase H1 [Parachaetomium inaequale]|uniref:Autophagy-related protein 1 n=1 Tax=Parachaetomium inaequale TaxID=2588326 RepID=A0AAN6P9N1_9PEZI|nr:Serine/threonine-protein kinase H1 [Parachaetomium inaequale]